jgi:hypothetical protein
LLGWESGQVKVQLRIPPEGPPAADLLRHEKALLGASAKPKDDISKRLNERWSPGSLHKQLRAGKHVKEWCERVRAITPSALADVCSQVVAEGVLEEGKGEAIVAYLRHRQTILETKLREALPKLKWEELL